MHEISDYHDDNYLSIHHNLLEYKDSTQSGVEVQSKLFLPVVIAFVDVEDFKFRTNYEEKMNGENLILLVCIDSAPSNMNIRCFPFLKS